MHMPSSTTPTSGTHTAAHRPGARDSHTDIHGERENAQRFRTLMHGKPQQAGDSEDDNPPAAEASLLDSDTDAGMDDSQPAPDREQALRDLLQRQLNQDGAAVPGLSARDQDDSDGGEQQDDHRDDGQTAANAGLQALHLAQQLVVQNSQQPAAASQAAAMTPALAELIERHVKQLLVPDASSRSAAQSREIMITLKDGLLPGTELWLSRNEHGWTLRADTRSGATYRSLVEAAPQLIERFAQSRLGTLEVMPTLTT